jgi:predicted transcriptional regulator of viral defense system
MPRTKATGPHPTWDRLYETAAPQGGYLTLGQAVAAGYSSPLVEYHVKSGRMERVARGIFRLVHFPPTDNEDLVVFWLWSEQRGVFSHETALALHELSDALPAKIHMTLPDGWRRRRLRVPRGLLLHYGDVDKADLTWRGPVPLTAPLRTVVDVTLEGDPALAEQATGQALARRMFSRTDLRQATARRRIESESSG